MKKVMRKTLKENDVKWGELNKSLNEAIKDNDWGAMKGFYNEMVYIVAKEGKNATYLLKERNRSELMMYKSADIKKVEIITARDFNDNSKYCVCLNCRPLEGKVLTVDEALETMPIPHPKCTKDVFDSGHGFCRCIYIAFRETAKENKKEK